MKYINFLLEDVGKAFVPKRVRPYIRSYMMKAGITEVPYKLFGSMFWSSFLIAALIFIFFSYPKLQLLHLNYLLTFLIIFVSWILVQGALVTLLMLGIYVYLDLRIFDRTRRMEAVLEDFLRFVSENLKGGMSFEAALWSAIRPEFGVLANEVRLAAKKVMTGQDVEEALTEFTSKYDSPMLKRSFELIIKGTKSGGEIAEIIDRVVENIGETKKLKAEMASTNLTYVIFITFVVVIITPILFTLSHRFLTILTYFSQRISTTAQTQITAPINLSNIGIVPADFARFSILALIIINVFAAMTVSMINKGSVKAGIKYIPFYAGATLIVYIIMMAIVSKVFGVFFAAF